MVSMTGGRVTDESPLFCSHRILCRGLGVVLPDRSTGRPHSALRQGGFLPRKGRFHVPYESQEG